MCCALYVICLLLLDIEFSFMLSVLQLVILYQTLFQTTITAPAINFIMILLILTILSDISLTDLIVH